jgi:hypothetical protein
MTNKSNPWQDMPESTQRRVKSDTPHNLFWITDLEGKYGFLLQSKTLFDDVVLPANLKGIELLKRNSTYGYGELFLVLNDKEEWHIFYTLCNDLISMTDSYNNDVAMISAVETRLKRWQQLLQQDRNKLMNLQRQMGLFSELLCLKDIVLPKYGIEQAIVSWVGADFDKQDFLLDDAVIEVKSYRTSKGQTVNISSIKQLISDKVPLFLLTYGLTQTENGESIVDIIKDIKKHLSTKSNEIKNEFENKLLEYGYIPEITKTEFYKFIVDKNRVFLTSGNFPKIQPKFISHGIIDVKYSIDLLECSDYEQNIVNFLESKNG